MEREADENLKSAIVLLDVAILKWFCLSSVINVYELYGQVMSNNSMSVTACMLSVLDEDIGQKVKY